MRKQANSVSQVHLDMRCTDCAKRAKRSRIPSFANNTQNKITRQIKHVETKIDKRKSQTFQLNQMDFSVMWHMAQDSQQPHAFSNVASNRLGNVQGAINKRLGLGQKKSNETWKDVRVGQGWEHIRPHVT